MNKEEPKVLTRMRLSCCWGDNLNEKELNEVVDYINWLQQKVNQLEAAQKEYYEVKKGDTLWGISKKYYGVGRLYYLIAKENKITNPDEIRVGQKLIIPDVELVEKV